MKTIDDEFVELSKSTPGFGGLYYDSLGTLTVFLKDPSTASQARSSVATFLSSREPPGMNRAAADASRMRVVVARYDFAELAAYYAALRAVLPSSGITVTDIDDRLNKIVIGVLNDATATVVNQALATARIPRDVVVVRQIPPAIVETTLQQYYRPLIAGLQIQFAGVSECTLSYSLFRYVGGVGDGHRYFLANSHCTDAFGVANGNQIGQPTIADVIGSEFADPALFTSAQDPRCPAGRQCRYSDAALVRLNASPEWFLGVVAKTSGSNLTITGTTTMQRQGWLGYVGLTMTKVGRTTGTTTGAQTAQCADVPQFLQGGFDTGRTMLCQAQASYGHNFGDSGSPVYFFNSGLYWAAGIHWGGGATFSNLNYAFSEFAGGDGQITFSVLP